METFTIIYFINGRTYEQHQVTDAAYALQWVRKYINLAKGERGAVIRDRDNVMLMSTIEFVY